MNCESNPMPWVGLNFYRKKDAPFFFGRDEPCEIIINCLKASRLTVLYGPSGVGKSSILHAGIEYQLDQQAQENQKEYSSPGFAVVIFNSWHDEPVACLIKRIQESVAEILKDSVKSLAWGASTSLAETLQQGMAYVEGKLFIILDQFEEYFLYRPEDDAEDKFAVEFPQIVDNLNLHVSFLISIREDSYAKLARFIAEYTPGRSFRSLAIEPLNLKSAGDAITRPLDRYNERFAKGDKRKEVKIEPELTQAILNELANKFNQRFLDPEAGRGSPAGAQTRRETTIDASMLQLVMTSLWEEAAGYDLYLRSVVTADDLVNEDSNVVIVALVGTDLHIRIFDTTGKRVVDKAENKLMSGETLTTLKKQLRNSLPDKSSLSPEQKQKIIRDAASIAGYTQAACLWSKDAGPRILNKKMLEQLGGMDEIVRRYFEVQMQGLSGEEKDIAARIFRYLATPSGTKIVQTVNDIVSLVNEDPGPKLTREQVRSLLLKLSNAPFRVLWSLNAPPNQPNETRFEVSHDVLALAILELRRRYLQDKQINEQINEQKKLRIQSIKQALPAKALVEQRYGHDELAALLARQAYIFNSQDNSQMLPAVDLALRAVFSTTPFKSILCRHHREFMAVAFSPNGRFLAAGSKEGKVWLWDLQRRGAAPTVFPAHWVENEVRSLAFSPDGRILASSSQDRTIKLLDVQKLINEYRPNVDPNIFLEANTLSDLDKQDVTSVAFRPPDGKLLASGSWNGTIWLWDIDRHQPLYPLCVHTGRIWSISFSPDGQWLASGGEDKIVRLWNLSQLATHQSGTTATALYSHDKEIFSVAFSPDGQWLASGSYDWTVRLWNLKSNRPGDKPKVFRGHQDHVRWVTFSPDSYFLASASEDETVRLWDVERPPGRQPLVLAGHSYGVSSIGFSPKDSRLLASASYDRTVRLWDISQPAAAPRVLEGNDYRVMSVAFSPDGRRLASGGWDNKIRLWDLTSPDDNPQVFPQHQGEVFAVAFFFSPDKRIQRVASASLDWTVLLWDLHQPEANPKVFRHNHSSVSSVAFSPDGKIMASSSHDGKIWLWNPDQPNSPINYQLHHGSPITSVAFSPDGKLLASGSDDATVILWNAEQPANPTWVNTLGGHTLGGHTARVWSVAFSPDGKLLASGSDDATVILWNVEQPANPSLKRRLTGHEFWVSSVAFSPDGRLLASGGYDHTIRLWNLNNLDDNPIVLYGHEQSVTSLAFSPNKENITLASGSYDNSVRLWTVATTDRLVSMVCEKVFRNLSAEEWREFIGDDISYQCTCPEILPGNGAPLDAEQSKPS